DAYRIRRDDLEQMAGDLSQSLQRVTLGIGGLASELSADLLDAAYQRMAAGFDKTHGGFGGAPKFPQPMNLEFLLRTYSRNGDQAALDHVVVTLRKMARGGIYDQLGGGFHRYSVDAVWLVPHFEKMLYDNAQLSRVYLHAWQVTRDDFFRMIAEEIYDYILREMTAPEGGFYSTTDADSEGEEGRFFVWTRDELQDLLGADSHVAIEYWGVTARGNFEGANILSVPNDDAVIAGRLGITVDELKAKLAALKDTLYAARTHRVHPGLDDKIVTAWNGLMLASLSEAARVFKRADYYDAALRCGEFLVERLMTADARLLRTYKDGQAKIDAYLEDYAALIDAFLELYQTTFDERWFDHARRLADRVLSRFRAPDGGFFDTSDDHESLIARPRGLQDNATPAGSSLIARGLIELTAYTGNADYIDAATGALRLLTAAMREYPQAFGEALNAVDMAVQGVAEIAIVGAPDDPATQALIDTAQQPYRPNAITALAPVNVDGEANIPLLSYRVMRGGAPTVYVCRHFACQMPVTTPDAMEKLLADA
ncbi:MAG: thioredoxin domain-containing protein, partial [Anaerolineae bacterium]|nr:thioredoxin domain-containing protein [Anaerolineae bacterium]